MLADRAKSYLDELERDHDTYRTWIAQVFSKAVSQKLEMPVLPYTLGHAIGGKVAARFADGRAFILELPDADYVVDLLVRGMVRKKLDETKARLAWSFVFGLGVTALEPLSQATYLDARFQLGKVKSVSKDQGELDAWGAFGDAAVLLADGFAQQVVTRDRRWIREHSPKGTDVDGVRQALETFRNRVVERVR